MIEKIAESRFDETKESYGGAISTLRQRGYPKNKIK